jgi:hypothetical protein
MTSRQAVTEDGQTFSIPLGLTMTSNATILDLAVSLIGMAILGIGSAMLKAVQVYQDR